MEPGAIFNSELSSRAGRPVCMTFVAMLSSFNVVLADDGLVVHPWLEVRQGQYHHLVTFEAAD